MNADDVPAGDERDLADAEDQPRSVLLHRVIPITALVLVAALAGLILYSVIRPADARGPAGVAINESGALVHLEPRPVSDFTLTLFDGDRVRLSDFRGQVVVVNFWASWCPPCREEARDLDRAWQELQDEDVVFLGLNVWDDQNNALAFIDEFDVGYWNGVTDENGVSVDFGVRGIPETFIINGDGLIVAKFIGPVTSQALVETVRQVQGLPAAQ